LREGEVKTGRLTEPKRIFFHFFSRFEGKAVGKGRNWGGRPKFRLLKKITPKKKEIKKKEKSSDGRPGERNGRSLLGEARGEQNQRKKK
jgi:hypothetical protein